MITTLDNISQLGLETKQPKFPHFCTVLYNTTISINNKLEGQLEQLLIKDNE